MQEMQEKWAWSLGLEDPLKEKMVIHSSTLAWKIPWTEEPDGLQSMVPQKAGLQPSVHTHAHAHTHVASSDQHETDIHLGVENSNPL